MIAPRPPAPSGFEPQELPGAWLLVWRWRDLGRPTSSRRAWWIVLALVPTVLLALRRAGTPGGLLLIALLVVGFGALAWHLAALDLNRTTLTIDGRTLKVDHRPLWWPGRLEVPLTAIAAFHTVRAARAWRVDAELQDGERIPLVVELPSRAHAEYVAIELTRRLHPELAELSSR